jgi:hypothetical protein
MTVRRSVRAAIGAVMLSLIATPVWSDPPHGKGKGKKNAEDSHRTSVVAASVGAVTLGISFEQARRIALEVGASGYQPLPPGIRKNLARGKPLPPGIAKRYAPAAMISRLPAHPGHEWRVVGTDLVLVAIATAVVVDILIDVFG